MNFLKSRSFPWQWSDLGYDLDHIKSDLTHLCERDTYPNPYSCLTPSFLRTANRETAWVRFTFDKKPPNQHYSTYRGSSYLLGQRFSACFVLKFALHSGMGEKREGVQMTQEIPWALLVDGCPGRSMHHPSHIWRMKAVRCAQKGETFLYALFLQHHPPYLAGRKMLSLTWVSWRRRSR